MIEKIKHATVDELHDIGVQISMSELSENDKNLYYSLIEVRLYDLGNGAMVEISEDVSVD